MGSHSKIVIFLIIFLFAVANVGALDFFSPRISAMFAIDSGEAIDSTSGTFSLDVVRTLCDEEEEIYEDFNDTYISVTVENPTETVLFVRRTRVKVPELGTKGRRLKLKRSAPIGSLELLPGESGQVLIPFLKVVGDQKYFAGTSVLAEESLPPKNVRVVVKLKSARGNKYHRRARTAFSFGERNNCS